MAIDKKTLLSGVNIEFKAGQLHGILGPNGSGKSTLLKLLSGIWKPSTGSVYWNGIPLLDKDRQAISRIIALVPQNPMTSFDFLAQDIVAMGRYAYERSYWNAVDEPVVQEALRVVDAWHLRHRPVNALSHGERQRIYIARALVTESPILLLDEPTSSLDIQHQIEIWQLLQNFVKEGKIVIVTTHDLSIAERYCHQIAILDRGKCLGSGHFSALITTKILQQVFGVVEAPAPLHCKNYALP